jgi:hypothetical protein
MRHSVIISILVLVILFTSYQASYSTVQVEFPTLNSSGISIDPYIELSIEFPFIFDLSRLPNVDSCNRNADESDSTLYSQSQMYLVSSRNLALCDSNLSLAILLSPQCYMDTCVNGNIVIKPVVSLDFDETYSLVIVDMRYINTLTQETLLIDTTFYNVFRTALPPTKLITTNLTGDPYLPYNTPITMIFSNKVAAVTGPSGSLFELSRVTGKSIIDSNYFDYIYTNENFITVISPDSTQVNIIPLNRLQMGSQYKLKVNNNILTGDSNDVFIYNFRIHDKGRIGIIPMTSDTLLKFDSTSFDNLKARQLYTVSLNDTLELFTPQKFGLWEFSHWESEDIPSINNDTLTHIYLHIDSSLIKYSLLNPVYKKVIVDTIHIQSPSGVTAIVYNYLRDLGNGYYLIPRKSDVQAFAELILNDSTQFIEWSSDDSLYNGNQNQSLKLNNLMLGSLYENPFLKGKMIGVGPGIENPVVLNTCNTYTICVEMKIPKSLQNDFSNINDYLEVTLNNSDLGLNNKVIENAEWQTVQWNSNYGVVKFCYDLDLQNYNGNEFEVEVNLSMKENNLGFNSTYDSKGNQDAQKGWKYTGYYPEPPNSNNSQDYGKILSVTIKGSKLTAGECKNTLTVEIEKYKYKLDIFFFVNEKIRIPDNSFYHKIYINNNEIYRTDKSYCNGENPKKRYIHNNATNKQDLILYQYEYYICEGDIVKVTPFVNKSSNNKAQLQLGDWLCNDDLITGYFDNDPSEICYTQNECNDVNNDKEISFPMNHNTHIQHQFIQNFAITALGLMKQYTNETPTTSDESVWYYTEYGVIYPGYKDIQYFKDGSAVSAMNHTRTGISYPPNIRHYQNIIPDHIFTTTAIKIMTNEDIDMSTVNNNLLVEDYEDRHDHENKTKYKPVEDYNLIKLGNVITYTMFNSQGLEACHLSKLALTMNSQLKSINNSNLTNPYTTSFHTEAPTLSIAVTDMEWIDRRNQKGDWGYGFYYYLATSAYIREIADFKVTRVNKNDNSAEKYPRIGENAEAFWNSPDPFVTWGPRTLGNEIPIVSYGRLNQAETVEIGYSVYIRRGNSGSGRAEFVSSLKSAIVTTISSQNKEAEKDFIAVGSIVGWLPVAGVIAGAIVGALANDLIFSGKDDYLYVDNNTYLKIAYNEWGTGGFYRKARVATSSSCERVYFQIIIQ